MPLLLGRAPVLGRVRDVRRRCGLSGVARVDTLRPIPDPAGANTTSSSSRAPWLSVLFLPSPSWLPALPSKTWRPPVARDIENEYVFLLSTPVLPVTGTSLATFDRFLSEGDAAIPLLAVAVAVALPPPSLGSAGSGGGIDNRASLLPSLGESFEEGNGLRPNSSVGVPFALIPGKFGCAVAGEGDPPLEPSVSLDSR